jgi:putative protease
LVSNYSQIERVKTKNIYGNYNFNVFNDSSSSKLKELGLKGITYSLELNGEELSNLDQDLDSEIIVYGRIPLMYSEYCVKKASKIDCNQNNTELKDRMNFKFPIICDKLNCVSVIFNSKILYLKDNFDIIKKINPKWIRIYITDEKMSQIINITNEYNEILGYNNNENNTYNEENINYTHTKGHYFRGV